MEYVVKEIGFQVGLSKDEIAAIRRMLSGNKLKFEVLSSAQIYVKIRVEVKEKKT